MTGSKAIDLLIVLFVLAVLVALLPQVVPMDMTLLLLFRLAAFLVAIILIARFALGNRTGNGSRL